ncbi:MAG: polysaccharide deacetylase family protein [Hyphomicrobiales bacterium]|nr:polysaccharide deacetylase family protein [Hyphomicrobiales bacterium]
MRLKASAIELGMRAFRTTALHKAAAPFTRGRGALLMLHRVRPAPADSFLPNRGLEITPAFLDAALAHIRRSFDLVTLDEALQRLASPAPGRPFAVVTFDDGYRDNVAFALPILERHEAPFIVYAVPGFADRSAGMWWVELEEAIRRLDRVRIEAGGRLVDMSARTPQEKQAAFEALYWSLRPGPEAELRRVCAALAQMAGLEAPALVDELCLDWDGIRRLAAHPLATIGAHTLTHPMLARHDPGFCRREIVESGAVIAREIGKAVRHFAYPVGDASAAGAREFAMARDAGFASAVTTRPGMLFPEHGAHLHALPRVSINGTQQSLDSLDVLLSGAPFMLWNRGRRLSVA